MPRHKYSIDKEAAAPLRKLANEQNFEERLRAFLGTDWQAAAPADIYRALSDAVIYLPFEVTFSRPYNIDRFPVFRARSNIDTSIENLGLWRTFSYPSPHFCGSNGRANVKGQPVFYASDHFETAVAELRPKDGDTVFVSQWLARCHRATASATILPLNLRPNNPWINVGINKRRGLVEQYKTEYGEEVSQRVERISEFVSSFFLTEEAPYPVSSSICDHYLYKTHGVDYFIYPSFRTSAGSCNIAFSPNFVDEFLKLDRVLELKIRKSHQSGAVVEIVAVGESWGGRIIWRPPEIEDDFAGENIAENNLGFDFQK